MVLRGDGFDLAERTARLGERVVTLAKRIPLNEVTRPLVSQFVRAGTSIGANYCEADEAESGKEFRYRISICKREAKETGFQVRMIVAAQPELKEEGRRLWQEAHELVLIFAAILRKKPNAD